MKPILSPGMMLLLFIGTTWVFYVFTGSFQRPQNFLTQRDQLIVSSIIALILNGLVQLVSTSRRIEDSVRQLQGYRPAIETLPQLPVCKRSAALIKAIARYGLTRDPLVTDLLTRQRTILTLEQTIRRGKVTTTADVDNEPSLLPVARACLEHSMSREERDRILGITRDGHNEPRDVFAATIVDAVASKFKAAGAPPDILWDQHEHQERDHVGALLGDTTVTTTAPVHARPPLCPTTPKFHGEDQDMQQAIEDLVKGG